MRHAIRARWAALLLLLLLLTLPTAVLANSGPPSAGGGRSSAPMPGKTEQVHVLREQLQFDLADGGWRAEVSAAYELANRGASLAPFPVIFVVQAPHDGTTPLTVTWNDRPLAVTQVEPAGEAELQRLAEAWGAERFVIDPVTAEVREWKPYGDQALQFFRFDLSLAEGESGWLRVAYAQAGGQERNRYVHRVYHYQYLLLPARGWASFGPLEIAIQAPPGQQAFFAANLPLTYADGAYRATLPGLPDQNLLFSLMSRAGVIGRWVEPAPYYWLVVVAVIPSAILLGVALGRVAARIRSWVGAMLASFGLSLLVAGAANLGLVWLVISAFTVLDSQGYGRWLMGALIWLLGTLLSVVASLVSTRQRHEAAGP